MKKLFLILTILSFAFVASADDLEKMSLSRMDGTQDVGTLTANSIICTEGMLLNGATADGAGDFIIVDDSANGLFKIDVSNGRIIVGTGGEFRLDGTTADANMVIFSAIDPTAARTFYIPDQTGTLRLDRTKGSVQTSQAGIGVSTVTGSATTTTTAQALTTVAIDIEAWGNISGANAAKKFHLYALDADVVTLTTGVTDVGDYHFACRLYFVSESAEDGMCKLTINGIASYVDINAAIAKDFSSGGVVQLRIESQNAGDTITSEYTETIWH